LLSGATLFDASSKDSQVSVMDQTAKTLHLQPGDRITFSVQGVPIDAVVSSVRTTDSERFRPDFEFVFQPAVLEGAPQSMLAVTRVEPGQSEALQTRVASAYPNVTPIDV